MPRTLLLLALLGACSPAPAALTPPASTPPLASTARARTPASAEARAPAQFLCTEIIGLAVTDEWYSAGFEQLVDDARFQARTRPHTFVDQWADPLHAGWSQPLTSPCEQHADNPDRVVLFAANWTFTTEAQWTTALEAFVTTVRQRYLALRDIQLFTVLRDPHNQTCGDPKSVVDPMIDAAISVVANHHSELVHVGPKLEAPDCSVFEKGGPHFTAEGRKLVAQQLAHAL
jgi:hypothetical protein